jgi:hypothetical protein
MQDLILDDKGKMIGKAHAGFHLSVSALIEWGPVSVMIPFLYIE